MYNIVAVLNLQHLKLLELGDACGSVGQGDRWFDSILYLTLILASLEVIDVPESRESL
jgi:hypothetical protein